MRGQQQKPVHPTCHLQRLASKHHFTSPPQHIKNSTSGMSKGMFRWQAPPEACLSWGSSVLLYEGGSTNSLPMCKFSTRKGSLPISRPCLIHYLSVLHCFFFSVNSAYFSRITSRSSASREGSHACGSCRLCPPNSQVSTLSTERCKSTVPTGPRSGLTRVIGPSHISISFLDFKMDFFQTNINPAI